MGFVYNAIYTEFELGFGGENDTFASLFFKKYYNRREKVVGRRKLDQVEAKQSRADDFHYKSC